MQAAAEGLERPHGMDTAETTWGHASTDCTEFKKMNPCQLQYKTIRTIGRTCTTISFCLLDRPASPPPHTLNRIQKACGRHKENQMCRQMSNSNILFCTLVQLCPSQGRVHFGFHSTNQFVICNSLPRFVC